jgi:hypothetical protein
MAKTGFAVPILPGKEDLATKHSIEEIRRRMTEYEESRRRAWVTMERVYLQRNPDGSNLFVIYAEAAGDQGDVIGTFATSGSDFDQWFLDVNQEITGIDFRQPPPGDGPSTWRAGKIPATAAARGSPSWCRCLPGKRPRSHLPAHTATLWTSSAASSTALTASPAQSRSCPSWSACSVLTIGAMAPHPTVGCSPVPGRSCQPVGLSPDPERCRHHRP